MSAQPMNQETILNRLPSFECRRCNECCKQPGFVYVNEKDLESLCHALSVSEFDFVNQYCDLQDRRQLVLKKSLGEACIFLTDEGCSVYTARPKQCRDFPFKWRTERSFDYCEGLKALSKGDSE